jgi:hypothetical protein
MTKRMTNTQFAATDPAFKAACTKAGVAPTPRQASKWRNKQGDAFTKGR